MNNHNVILVRTDINCWLFPVIYVEQVQYYKKLRNLEYSQTPWVIGEVYYHNWIPVISLDSLNHQRVDDDKRNSIVIIRNNILSSQVCPFFAVISSSTPVVSSIVRDDLSISNKSHKQLPIVLSCAVYKDEEVLIPNLDIIESKLIAFTSSEENSISY